MFASFKSVKQLDYRLALSHINILGNGSLSTRDSYSHDKEYLMMDCGTGTASQEIIGLKNGTICKGDGYAQEVDVWALGVLIYMLVSGMPPFNGKNHADVIWILGISWHSGIVAGLTG